MDNAGNILTQDFLRAEELNVHFSSVFTRKYTSSLPVPETKFSGPKGGNVGAVSCNCRKISTSLAHVFNIILHEGNVPLNSNKQGSTNKTNNYMPVTLTSVTCKVLGKQKIGGISHQT